MFEITRGRPFRCDFRTGSIPGQRSHIVLGAVEVMRRQGIFLEHAVGGVACASRGRRGRCEGDG